MAESDSHINHNFFTKEKAGFFVWTVMHLYSAYVPELPTPQEQEEIKTLVTLLGKYFPCKDCSNHFQRMISENPIEVESREAFMQYLCRIHNLVNKRIGKEIFPCENIVDIWGQKDCGCEVKKIQEVLNETD